MATVNFIKNRLLILLITLGCVFEGCNQSENKQVQDGAFPIVYKGHLYIPGTVNNINGNYVFDTGATNLYLDKTHYSDNNFEYKNTSTGLLPGAGTKPQKITVIRDTVQFNFGNYVYKTTTVPVIHLKSILGDIADGIIGIEYFSETVLEINYENEYMKIYPHIDSVAINDWDNIKLTRHKNRLYIPLSVSINDSISISGNYLLDFGSGGAVSLTSSSSRAYNLDTNITNKTPYFTKYGGIGGESSSYDFVTRSITMGNFKFNNVTMDFSVDKSGALASDKYPGIIGNKIFERFDIVIDFKNDMLYLSPNTSYNNIFKPPRLGFSYVDWSQSLCYWLVSGIYSSLNADRAGLKIDDRILSINGVDVNDISYELQKSYFDDLDEVHLIVERDGEIIEFHFQLKPILTITKNKWS